jgi:hypothetical protein
MTSRPPPASRAPALQERQTRQGVCHTFEENKAGRAQKSWAIYRPRRSRYSRILRAPLVGVFANQTLASPLSTNVAQRAARQGLNPQSTVPANGSRPAHAPWGEWPINTLNGLSRTVRRRGADDTTSLCPHPQASIHGAGLCPHGFGSAFMCRCRVGNDTWRG